MELFLKDTAVKFIPTNKKALYLAGEMWKLYFTRKKKDYSVPSVVKFKKFFCERCGTKISNRQHIITDFIIGAFALLQSNIFLTRDRGFYKDYFKNLIIKNP